jgi:hypothetical protein
MSKDIKESANINPGQSKETFLHYYKEIWNTENVDDEIITMEELKEAVKKMENHLTKIT